MMGPRQETRPTLFYEFSLDDHTPHEHLLRSIDRFVDLSRIRSILADFHSHRGQSSVDPELLTQMLLLGCCFGFMTDFDAAFMEQIFHIAKGQRETNVQYNRQADYLPARFKITKWIRFGHP